MSSWALIFEGTWDLTKASFWRLLHLPCSVWNFFVRTPNTPHRLRLKLGYAVWILAFLMFGVPEIEAARRNNPLPFKTLSGTVGYVEQQADWVAIFVVLAIVFALFHSVRVARAVRQHRRHLRLKAKGVISETAPLPEGIVAAKAYVPRKQRTVPPGRLEFGAERIVVEDGRITKAADPEYMSWIGYYLFALALLLAALFIPWGLVEHWQTGGHSQQVVGDVFWIALFLVFFIVPGVLAYAYGRLVPFTTVFATFLDLEQRARWFTVVAAAGLVFLMLHLVFYPWPSIIPWFPDLKNLHNNCVEHATDVLCQRP